ncbi:MAG: hypothetical protein QM756_07725 [Polyangiaceae bacterium]
MPRLICAGLIFLSSLGLARSAVAQELRTDVAQGRVPPPVFKLWVMPPLSHINFMAGVMVGGASAQLVLKEFWTVEAGAAAMFTGIQGLSPDIFVRAGVVPLTSDARDASGRGMTTQLVALVGSWYIKRFTNPDGHYGTETTHAVRANLGLDFTRHASPLDFSLRLISGVAVPVWQQRTGDWASHLYTDPDSDLKYAIEMGFDFGVGF